MKFTYYINNKVYKLDVDGEQPLLWLLRDKLGLTGTKFGCGIGICGVCMVLIDGEAVQSCQVSVSAAADRKITTIEGLSGQQASDVQQAWIHEQVPQCGYCQPGQIITATALLSKHPVPTQEQVNAAMSRVLCRCGSYPRVRRAIVKIVELNSGKTNEK